MAKKYANFRLDSFLDSKNFASVGDMMPIAVDGRDLSDFLSFEGIAYYLWLESPVQYLNNLWVAIFSDKSDVSTLSLYYISSNDVYSAIYRGQKMHMSEPYLRFKGEKAVDALCQNAHIHSYR